MKGIGTNERRNNKLDVPEPKKRNTDGREVNIIGLLEISSALKSRYDTVTAGLEVVERDADCQRSNERHETTTIQIMAAIEN